MRMSTIGSGTRSSTSTQATAQSPLTTNMATTRGVPQPHEGPSVSASRKATSVADSVSAPSGSSRDGVFSGDSGTNRQTPTAAIPTTAEPTMNSQRQDA